MGRRRRSSEDRFIDLVKGIAGLVLLVVLVGGLNPKFLQALEGFFFLVVAVAVVLLLATAVVLFCLKRRKRSIFQEVPNRAFDLETLSVSERPAPARPIGLVELGGPAYHPAVAGASRITTVV